MSNKILSELTLILLGALGICLLLALASYHPQDPGFNFVGHDAQVQNWLGLVGAYLSSLLFLAFGWLAYLFPLFVLHGAWRGFKQVQNEQSLSFAALLLPLVAWFIAVAACCALASFHFQSGLPLTAGGVLGLSIRTLIEPYLAIAGSTLLLLTLLLVSTSVAYQLSWLAIVDRIGLLVLSVCHRLMTLVKPEPRSRSVGNASTKPSIKRVPKSSKPANVSPSWLANTGSRLVSWLPTWSSFKRSTSGTVASKHERQAPVLDPLFATDTVDDATLDAFNTPMTPPSRPLPAVRQDLSTQMEQLQQQIQQQYVQEPSKLRQPTSADSKTLLAVDPLPPSNKPVTAQEPKQLRIEQLRSEQSNDDEFLQLEPVKVSKSPAMGLPNIELLSSIDQPTDAGYSDEQLADMAENLVARLADFGVKVEIDTVCPGPVITRFEVQPAPGVKASRISGLARDLGRSMAIASVRVVEVIPGKRTVGIEVPNAKRAIVSFKEVLQSQAFAKASSPLTLALGHDIAGEAVVADLAKMPHLLVAGTTGSGKSVGVNAMILSMLFKAGPDELKLMLIDPKMLELSVYEGIPHLLTPVITDMKDAAQGLRWCVAEMERRYKLMSKLGVRNIDGYNQKVIDARALGQPIFDPLWDPMTSLEPNRPPELQTLPMIVVVVDEFADMMMIVGKKVEELIARIAQKARAAGIHLILATQRPSVDVITGLIKANVPTRIAFQVSSKIDSRTILDQGGAEQLLGHGDMLFMPPGKSLPLRVHGAYVPDEDVHALVDAWKQRGEPQYLESIFSDKLDDSGMLAGLVDSEGSAAEGDPLYDQAVQIVLESGKPTISYLQRQLRIGYNRSANLIQDMEQAGLISPAGHNGAREILVNNGNQ